MRLFTLVAILPVLFSCSNKGDTAGELHDEPLVKQFKTINDITVPAGYQRLKTGSGTFGEWLRNIPLKKSKTVYCWDGSLKKN